uniref:Uncharacterized protein n=1 Tax=Rhodnius prolixus TaxID=13249 RepID=T1I9D8_RHOPR
MMQTTQKLSPYICFVNTDRKLVFYSIVELNEYYNCMTFRKVNANISRDIATRKIKEMQTTQKLSPYISFVNTDRKVEFCTIVEINEYYNCMSLRSVNASITRDIAIRKKKEMETTQKLSAYISFVNTDTKQEFCSKLEVNEYYNCMAFRRVNANISRDIATRKMKEMQTTQKLSPYISFVNTDRKVEFCTTVEINEYSNCMTFRRVNANITRDIAIRKKKEMETTQKLSAYISFVNTDRKNNANITGDLAI